MIQLWSLQDTLKVREYSPSNKNLENTFQVISQYLSLCKWDHIFGFYNMHHVLLAICVLAYTWEQYGSIYDDFSCEIWLISSFKKIFVKKLNNKIFLLIIWKKF